MKIGPASAEPALPALPPMDHISTSTLICVGSKMPWVVDRVGEGTEIGVSGEESRGEWEREQGCMYSPHRAVQEVSHGFEYIVYIITFLLLTLVT